MYTHQLMLEQANGDQIGLDHYQGKLLLIVNVASRCGFTPQYRGLNTLYQRFHPQGLEVLLFPCNQFAKQESGDIESIQNFCQTQYHNQCTLFQKINVNGTDTHPLYQLLKQRAPGFLGSRRIKWNFCKFLVSRDGEKIRRFAPWTSPQKIEKIIEDWL